MDCASISVPAKKIHFTSFFKTVAAAAAAAPLLELLLQLLDLFISKKPILKLIDASKSLDVLHASAHVETQCHGLHRLHSVDV